MCCCCVFCVGYRCHVCCLSVLVVSDRVLCWFSVLVFRVVFLSSLSVLVLCVGCGSVVLVRSVRVAFVGVCRPACSFMCLRSCMCVGARMVAFAVGARVRAYISQHALVDMESITARKKHQLKAFVSSAMKGRGVSPKDLLSVGLRSHIAFLLPLV